jgi:hypothetical protein
MRPASFDSVVCARQIVYSYSRHAAGEAGAAAAATTGARPLTGRTRIPHHIMIVRLGIVSAIGLNLWWIAARNQYANNTQR